VNLDDARRRGAPSAPSHPTKSNTDEGGSQATAAPNNRLKHGGAITASPTPSSSRRRPQPTAERGNRGRARPAMQIAHDRCFRCRTAVGGGDSHPRERQWSRQPAGGRAVRPVRRRVVPVRRGRGGSERRPPGAFGGGRGVNAAGGCVAAADSRGPLGVGLGRRRRGRSGRGAARRPPLAATAAAAATTAVGGQKWQPRARDDLARNRIIGTGDVVEEQREVRASCRASCRGGDAPRRRRAAASLRRSPVMPLPPPTFHSAAVGPPTNDQRLAHNRRCRLPPVDVVRPKQLLVAPAGRARRRCGNRHSHILPPIQPPHVCERRSGRTRIDVQVEDEGDERAAVARSGAKEDRVAASDSVHRAGLTDGRAVKGGEGDARAAAAAADANAAASAALFGRRCAAATHTPQPPHRGGSYDPRRVGRPRDDSVAR